MSIGYEVQKKPGFIFVISRREFTNEVMEEFFEEVPKLAYESGVSKILVDCRAISKLVDVDERFNYAVNIAKCFNGLEVAAVADIPLRDPELFGEKVAQKLGANFHMCSNMKEACAWLDIGQDQISSS